MQMIALQVSIGPSRSTYCWASNDDRVVFDQDEDMGDILVPGGVQKMMGADMDIVMDCPIHPRCADVQGWPYWLDTGAPVTPAVTQ